uniref:Clavesin-1 n=2 Tax=Neoaves TaxID=3078114 RepID=A0A8D2ML34_ZONAL
MTHLQAGLSPETIEKARLELNENPDILHQDIQQVRDMIITRPDIGFLRTDDAFILRFLRARKFHQTEAFRLLAQYFQYRQLNLDMFKNFKADDPGIKRALTDGFPGVLENRDHCGRKILLLFAANWDQSRNSFIDILRAILLSLEVLIEDQELQINGFILIIDWSNFSFKQASKLTPSILKLAIEGLQDSFPARFGGVHFVNQPWYIHALYTLIKPFLKDKTRKRIFLHGNNLNSLHQLIHPECLPSEFGGTLPPYDMGTWARTLLGPDYSDENEYTHTSYNAMHVKHASSNLEREASPKPMKRLVLPSKSALFGSLNRLNLTGRAHLAQREAVIWQTFMVRSASLWAVLMVWWEKGSLSRTVITCLITVHENEGKLMSPCTEHYRKYIRVRCWPARCSAPSAIQHQSQFLLLLCCR